MADSEYELAFRFAPVVYHAAGELNLPANVDWFLKGTSLWLLERGAAPQPIVDRPRQIDLIVGGAAATVVAPEDQRSRHREFARAEFRWSTAAPAHD